MWLHGSVGCGKRILTSGIIDDMQRHCAQSQDRFLAFYFFDFSDDPKQDSLNMVRSLLYQFINACLNTPSALQYLHDRGNQASEQELLAALRKLSNFSQCQSSS